MFNKVKIDNNYKDTYEDFTKNRKSYIYCKYSLYDKYGIDYLKKDVKSKYLKHDDIQVKSPNYLFFEHLVANNSLEDAINVIIKRIKDIKLDLNIELKLSNWCKKKNPRFRSSTNKLTIVDIVVKKEYKINFENWQIALATESIRRNRLCYRNCRFICKRELGMKIERNDICCGGINCKFGLHINNIKSYNGTIYEAYQFNNEKNKSVIEILRMKKTINKIINSKKISPENKLKNLLSSFMFDINKGIISKNYFLKDKSENKKNNNGTYNWNLFLNVLDEIDDNLNKKRSITPDKYVTEVITRPGSVSPHMIEKSDWINILRTSPISELNNSSFNYNLSKIIEMNNVSDLT